MPVGVDALLEILLLCLNASNTFKNKIKFTLEPNLSLLVEHAGQVVRHW